MLLAWLLACGGGAPAVPPVVKVALGVDNGEMTAWRVLDANGHVDAGRMSAGSQLGHQDVVELGKEGVQPIFAAAQALVASNVPTSAGVATPVTVSLQITQEGRDPVAYRWKFGDEPPAPEIKAVTDPIFAMHSGDW